MRKSMLVILSILCMSTMLGLSFNQVTSTSVTSRMVISDYNSPQYSFSPQGNQTQWRNMTNNQLMNVSAGQQHRFRTESGNLIRLQVNTSVQLRVNESDTNPAGPLQNGTRAVNKYMHIELNGSCGLNATLYRNFTHAELGLLQGNASQFHWAFYNETSAQWQYAYQNWVSATPNGATVACNTTHFSVWTILAPPQGNQTQWRNMTNNQLMNVSAGQQHRFRTQSGNLIRLQVNASVQFRVNESDTNPAGSLQNGTRAVNKYMHIELNGSCGLNATLYRNFTHAELGLLQGNASQFRWAFYNETSAQWQYAYQNWVSATPNGATVACNTTHFSVWTILAPEVGEEQPEVENPTPGTPFNAANGTIFALKNGSTYQIRTQSGYQIELKIGADAEMNITEHPSYKHQNRIQNRYQRRTQYMSIHVNVSGAQVNATLSRTFSQGELNQLQIQNMAQLRFMFYNESSGAWEAPQNQWHNGNTLYCNTNHFSTWAILEETTTLGTPGFESGSVILVLMTIVIAFYLRRKKE